ncbi:FAD-dependent oxidoreductase [Streptomyces sp. NBC_01549]|uniref:NAD(P)/FAD-dependent oxidoreductase n=1 Tax=unclassified Streptomyces TaxID=2593676 RepID=UPI00225764C1|nr:FAD-dependent oxidoreductase [Streptomyces sp. NBC_01549]MCX4597192.1 FAD-dependent oxidoreductase [Streptomyces sp. NBC_01549]
MTADVLVIGGSVGGLTTVEALRGKGFRGTVQVVGAEAHLPYDRPPLSKKILSGIWDEEQVRLRGQQELDALDAEFLLGCRAVRLDVEAHGVVLEDGQKLGYGRLVLATGLTPRTLPGAGSLRGAWVLRTLEDSTGLRAQLLTARDVVIIGAGVLGCEVAATAREMGLNVTLIDPNPTPMWRQTGAAIGQVLSGLHAARGVRLLMGTRTTCLLDDNGRVTGVGIKGGETVPADVVVVTIGSIPATDWLVGSGLTLNDGIVCDERGRAAPDVYAVGDVARWSDERTGVSTRLENRTNAVRQAVFVAGDITGAQDSYQPVPYFWTDQYDVRIQVFGSLPEDAHVRLIDGTTESRKFVMVAEKEGQAVGVVGWNSAKAVMAAKNAYLS